MVENSTNTNTNLKSSLATAILSLLSNCNFGNLRNDTIDCDHRHNGATNPVLSSKFTMECTAYLVHLLQFSHESRKQAQLLQAFQGSLSRRKFIQGNLNVKAIGQKNGINDRVSRSQGLRPIPHHASTPRYTIQQEPVG